MYKMLKDDALFKYKKVCIVGDFNFPTIKWKGEWSGNNDNDFIECIRDAFLIQMVVKPTRTRLGQNRNILDLVFVNEVRLVSTVEHCSPIANSDHETLFFTLYIGIENENENAVNYTYDLAKGNYVKMRNIIQQADWSQLDHSNVEQCWSNQT